MLAWIVRRGCLPVLLARRAEQVLDPAVRSTLLYIRTQLLSDVPEDEAGGAGAGATEQPQQEQQGQQREEQQGGGAQYLAVDEATTERLLRFIAAAEAWGALHALVRSWTDRRPGVLVADALQVR